MRGQTIVIGMYILLMFNFCSSAAQPQFVTVEEGQFILGEKSYHFLGTNFWYGMNLGMEGKEGDRARLKRELDHLKSIGVDNLRVMAASDCRTPSHSV